MSTNVSRRQFLGLAAGSAATILGLGLVGCGSSTSTGSTAGPAAGSASSSSDKTYLIVTDTVFAPFEYTDENGDFVGIDMDLLAAIAEDQGFKYEVQSIGFDAALAAIQSDQADGIIAGMGINDERKKTYDFSEPYFTSSNCISAAATNDEITGLDDIYGRTAAVKTGSQGAAYAESLKDEYNLTLVYFDTSDLMYQDVLAGNSELCFEYYPVMYYGSQHDNGLKVVYKNPDNTNVCGFAVKKDKNTELLEMFDTGLQNLRDSGKYEEIVGKYIDLSVNEAE